MCARAYKFTQRYWQGISAHARVVAQPCAPRALASMAEDPICESLLSLPEVWSGRREFYEAPVQGVQLVFGIPKFRYNTDVPNAARAHITEFVINKGTISIAILTEDVDDSILARLQMVNPLTVGGQAWTAPPTRPSPPAWRSRAPWLTRCRTTTSP